MTTFRQVAPAATGILLGTLGVAPNSAGRKVALTVLER